MMTDEARVLTDRAPLASPATNEQSTDSNATKAEGAILNSLVFVAFITCATFGIFFLFKYNCTRVIWGYMGFSGLLIFGVLGSMVGMEVLQALGVPLDIITFGFIVYNFSIVGVLVTFFWPAPLVVKQLYLIFIGTVVAFYFTRIPEWTTWVLLVAMAVYDLFAVLTPGGPLRVLVELAQERDEDIPALVYTAAPVQRGYGQRGGMSSGGGMDSQRRGRGGGGVLEGMMAVPEVQGGPTVGASGDGSGHDGDGSDQGGVAAGESTAATGASSSAVLGITSASAAPRVVGIGGGETASESQPLIGGGGGSSSGGQSELLEFQEGPAGSGEFFLPDSIKLGLGDFIFYSVLVGRAAMYDMFTMFACYFAIIQGLIATLLLLGFFHKALPALPISIAMGVVTYIGSRIFLEPLVQQMATHNLIF